MHPMFWSWHRPHVWPSKTHYSEQIWIFNQPEITSIKNITLWKDHEIQMVGGLEHELYFSIQLGMSSSQLTFTPSFFRGVSSNHQPNHVGVQKKSREAAQSSRWWCERGVGHDWWDVTDAEDPPQITAMWRNMNSNHVRQYFWIYLLNYDMQKTDIFHECDYANNFGRQYLLISANWYSEYTQIPTSQLAQLCCVYKVKIKFTPRNHP